MLQMVIGSDEEIEDTEEKELEIKGEEQEDPPIEQAIISMYNTKDQKAASFMKFKGNIGTILICALLDSGSTHSFINPELIQGLHIPLTQKNPMVVVVANGGKMVTDSSCEALKFSLQGEQFEKDVRLLTIQGYDMILGLDWLMSLGPMKIDWEKAL